MFDPFLHAPPVEDPAERRNRNSAEYEAWLQAVHASNGAVPPTPPSVSRLLQHFAGIRARLDKEFGIDTPPAPGAGYVPALRRGRGQWG